MTSERGCFVVKVLRLPHLVLTHVGYDNCVAAGDAPQIVHHVRGVQVAGVGKVLDVADRHRALAGFDGLEPCRAVAAGDTRQQFLEHRAQIADEGNVNLDVLVDLGRIDFDVNLLGLQRVGTGRAGDAIVKAHAAGDQQICFLNGVVDPRLAVHAHHAQVQRMRGREVAESQQRERHWNLRALGQRPHLLHRAGLGNAVPGKNHRPLCILDQLGRVLQTVFFHVQHGVRTICSRLGSFEVEDRRALLRILGDVDQHRPGAPAHRNLKCVADRVRNVLCLVHKEVVLGHGQRDAGDVHFLKRVGAEHLAGHVAGDADHRNGIEHCGGNAGDEIGCAGAAGGDCNAHLARGARIAVGHVRRALLVPHENVVNGKLAQRVVDRQNRSARIAEDRGHALAHQRGPDDFCAGEARGRVEVGRLRIVRLRCFPCCSP